MGIWQEDSTVLQYDNNLMLDSFHLQPFKTDTSHPHVPRLFTGWDFISWALKGIDA